MNKILVSIMLALLAPFIFSGCVKKKIATEKIPEQTAQEKTNINAGQNQEVAESEEVPLPQGGDIVRLFFNLLDEKRIPEAVAMMNPALYPDEASKQEYGVQFNIFDSISAKSVEPFSFGDETENEKTYKAVLQVKIKPGAAKNAPIPNYGWENGENIRWICLEKIENVWKISCISTGP